MALKRAYVYGTLMTGLRNYVKCLEGRVVKAERAFVYGKLYHLHAYNCPGLLDGEDRVWGEVITFEDEGHALTRSMDQLEEFTGDPNTSLYVRIPRIVHFEDHKEILDVYLFAQGEELTCDNSIYLKHGDWRIYVETGRTE